ncbi:MAG: hypothetical protein MUF15_11805 [Acidobacteria bacterium]|nr:hypothetical protein [Acidobacteriota bacterium]
MDYKVGTHIPEGKILRRYTDEDGEIFLEVRGIENAYYRVTSDNYVYYKIEKALMENEELNILDDFSKKEFNDETDDVFELNDFEESEQVIEIGPDLLMKEEYIRPTPEDELEMEVTELEERQVTPTFLRPLCKRTAYGGYSLRYHKFLYMLDKDYRVEMKTPDSMSDYMMAMDDKIRKPVLTQIPISAPTTMPPPHHTSPTITPFNMEAFETPVDTDEKKIDIDWEIKNEYQKGDILPLHLRECCEEDIATGGGRVIIGNYLYLLDADYVISARMKLSHLEDDAVIPGPPPAPVPSKQIPVEKIIENVIKHVEMALDKYKIDADFFKENVLGPGNRETLIQCYNGDLTTLNDDTREAAAQGKLAVLTGEEGFTLLRAAILHELYIKTTLAGRGNNMKFFITHIIAVEPDGRANEFRGDWSLEKQRELINFFNKRANVYTDKTMLIRQLYRNLYSRDTIFEEYKATRDAGGNVSFNAFLIFKLYELTTRLDRGDGITMIRLSRDIMDFK